MTPIDWIIAHKLREQGLVGVGVEIQETDDKLVFIY